MPVHSSLGQAALEAGLLRSHPCSWPTGNSGVVGEVGVPRMTRDLRTQCKVNRGAPSLSYNNESFSNNKMQGELYCEALFKFEGSADDV